MSEKLLERIIEDRYKENLYIEVLLDRQQSVEVWLSFILTRIYLDIVNEKGTLVTYIFFYTYLKRDLMVTERLTIVHFGWIQVARIYFQY